MLNKRYRHAFSLRAAFFGALLGLGVAVPATGQEPAGPAAAAFRAFVREVIRQNAALSAAWGTVAAAGERIAPAGALPDPIVRGGIISLPNPSFAFAAEAMTQVPLGFEQQIPGFGKRAARTRAAAADSAWRSGEAEALGARLASEAASRFAHLMERRQTLALHGSRLQLATAALAATESRFASGSAPLTDVIRARVRLVQLEEEREALVAEVAGALAAANALRNSDGPLDTPADAREVIAQWPLPPPAQMDTMVARDNPDLRTAEAAVERAARVLSVHQVASRPDFTVALQEGIRFGGREPFLTALVGVSVPLWQGRKQRPLATAAALELEAARDQREDLAARLRGDLQSLAARIEGLQRRISRVDQQLIPLARAASTSALQQYRTGMTDLTAVLEAQDDQYEADRQLAGLVAAFLTARSRLAALLGEEWYQ